MTGGLTWPELQHLGLHSLGLFALTVLVLNATPGVDMLYAVSRTLSGGPRAGLAAALGISAGCVVHALGAAFGLAALMAVSAWAFTALKWAGALYLAWLGWDLLRQAWRPAAGTPGRPAAAAPAAWGAVFRQGLLTNLLNPKVALFFLAFLPQFIRPEAGHQTLAFLVLGAWMVLQGTLFLLALVAVVAALRRLGGSPALGRGLKALGGALFLGLAVRLASTAREVTP
jgi:threonine/homoserine/homoserine lactone efflux protein